MKRNIKLYTWFERDRAHVELRDEDTQDTIIELWDDEYIQAVDDGWIDPKHLFESLLKYANDRGLL